MITQVNFYPISGRIVTISDVAGRVEDTVSRRVMSRLMRRYQDDDEFELIAEYRKQLKIYARHTGEVQ